MKVNKVIKILISADLLFMSGIGLVAPVFAIFLLDSIQGGSATLAGAAVAVYLVTKSILRLPIAYYLDKSAGERDDFYAMILGYVVITLCNFLYIFAKVPLHIYMIQVLLGVGAAFAFTPWYGFFTRHIDKHHENLEWSIEISLAGIGMAAAGFLSGIIADHFGFTPLFIVSGVFSLMGTVLVLTVGKHLKPDTIKRRFTPPGEKHRHHL